MKIVLLIGLLIAPSAAMARGAFFYDNFDRDFDSDLGFEWYESGDVILSDGIVRARQDGLSVMIATQFSAADVTVSTTFDHLSDPYGRINTSVGVLARAPNDAEGYLARHVRTARNGGVVQIVKLGGRDRRCDSRRDGCVLAQQRVNDLVGRLELRVEGNRLLLSVNGRVLATARDSEFQYGTVGLRFNGWYGPLADDFVADGR